jgi:thiol-disulfide isomerase/thioredoxin
VDFSSRLEVGFTYEEFLAKYANDEERRRWDAIYIEVVLTSEQQELLRSFRRTMNLIVVAGTWCGDCVEQCPIFERFAEQNDRILIRYFDRDDNPDLADALSTCGGRRVPSVLFLSEDGFVCGRFGDRTLAKYRQIASAQTGAACPTGLVVPERSLMQQVTEEWLHEFERIQLMLRTSGRLRKLHGD